MNLLSVSLTTNLNLIGQNSVNLIGSLGMMFSCSPPLAAMFTVASIVFFYASKKFGEVSALGCQRARLSRPHLCQPRQPRQVTSVSLRCWALSTGWPEDAEGRPVRDGGHERRGDAGHLPQPAGARHTASRVLRVCSAPVRHRHTCLAKQCMFRSSSPQVRTFAAEDHETSVYGASVKELVVKQSKTKLIWAIYMPFVTLFNALLVIGVFSYMHATVKTRKDASDFAAFIFYTTRIQGAMNMISSQWTAFSAAMGAGAGRNHRHRREAPNLSLKRRCCFVKFRLRGCNLSCSNLIGCSKSNTPGEAVFDLIDRKPAQPTAGGLWPSKPATGRLELQRVSFSYPSRPAVLAEARCAAQGASDRTWRRVQHDGVEACVIVGFFSLLSSHR